MQFGPFTIGRTKSLPPLSPVGAGGWLTIREPYTGAWQQNVQIDLASVETNPTVFACQTLIAADIAKLRLRLVSLDDDGIWNELDSPAFSPVLRKPNRFQTRLKFVEQWMLSKLSRGNTYVLKERDARGLVVALYVLDPSKVTPLVAPDGSVYYQLCRNDLASLPEDVIVPAREVIHDRMYTPYHPLVGVSPIVACGLAATQGSKISSNSALFFGAGANPGGVLTAPGAVSDATAARLKAYWEANYTGANVGRVAVVGDGLKYEPMTMTAVDSQLIDQLKWTSETICSAYHVPPYMVGVGPPPPYNSATVLYSMFYAQCLQSLIESLELALDEGLELPRPYGTEFDLDDLMRMDSDAQVTMLEKAVRAGLMERNEGRKKLNLPPLADAPEPEPEPEPDPEAEDEDETLDFARFATSLLTKVGAIDYAA